MEVTLQTNGDLRLGSIRCPAVEKPTPFIGLLWHPLSAVSEILHIRSDTNILPSTYTHDRYRFTIRQIPYTKLSESPSTIVYSSSVTDRPCTHIFRYFTYLTNRKPQFSSGSTRLLFPKFWHRLRPNPSRNTEVIHLKLPAQPNTHFRRINPLPLGNNRLSHMYKRRPICHSVINYSNERQSDHLTEMKGSAKDYGKERTNSIPGY